jgi:NAD(P)-dependent dehydrogenase (short-subunit alcohol dehydrogenase family)
MSVRDKVLIVTGGTSGIGEGCSRHFASLGARVVIASNQAEPGASLERELRGAGHAATFVFTDVANEESVQALVRRTVELHGRVDGIHCNAGVWAQGKVTDFDDTVWSRVMNVNVKSVFWTAKHAVPVMERQGRGVIVITTSVAAFVGFPSHALYCASKAALDMLVRVAAVEWAPGVRVNAVAPGVTDTAMLGPAPRDRGWLAGVAGRTALGRLGTPDDVAAAVDAVHSLDWLTGEVVTCDGGLSLHSPIEPMGPRT